jgi:hypothetical protein
MAAPINWLKIIDFSGSGSFATTSKVSLIMTIQLFCNSDAFLQTMWHLRPRDICRVGMVCRSWQTGLNEGIRTLHKAYGLPEVEGGEYNIRNFGVLAATGLNEKQIRALYSKYIGEPVGLTPFVTHAQIEELCKPDPDQPEKRKFETHRGVILFPAVKRSFGKGVAATLDEESRLTINEDGLDLEEKELTIPLSIRNVIELFKHPKAGNENGSVFNCIIPEIDHCTACIKIPSIEYVRREVPEGNRNKEGFAQMNRLPGTPVAGFLLLMIPCGFDILETGTCSYVPTGKYEGTYPCTSDYIVIHGVFYHLELVVYPTGLNVYSILVSDDADIDSAIDNVGTVPTIFAEVRPLDLGSLDIGKDR